MYDEQLHIYREHATQNKPSTVFDRNMRLVMQQWSILLKYSL